jgi:zinc D-Ala-D-Ala carboxypeptidase
MKMLDTTIAGAILLGAVTMTDGFNYNEFIHSDTATKNKIENVPSPDQIENGKALFKNIVQPIRDRFGEIRITSAFRNPELNRMVGGVGDSQHMSGQAVDIQTPGISRYDVAHWIIENLEYDQLILEPTWLHISYSRVKNRKQNLKYSNGDLIPYKYK